MSSGYLVKCPRVSCHWFGELPARPDPEAWRDPDVAAVVFECPGCQREWRARVIGSDVEALPLEMEDELESALWPPVDLGEGG